MANNSGALPLLLGLDVPTARTLAAYGPLLQALGKEGTLPSTGIFTIGNPADSPAKRRIAGPPVAESDKTWIVRARRAIRTMVGAVGAPIDDAEGLLVAMLKFQPAFLSITNHRGIVGKQRLLAILGPVRDAVRVAKDMVRNVETLNVTRKMQRDMRTLIIDVSAECLAALSTINTKSGIQGYWPKGASPSGVALQAKTTRFSSKLVVAAPDRTHAGRNDEHITVRPSRPKRVGSGTTDGTADLSGGSSHDKPILSRSSSFSDGFWLFSNMSDGSTMSEISDMDFQGRAATGNNATMAFSPRVGREKAHIPRKVSVSPGATFVAHRSARQAVNPRGTSLGGTGAVVVR